MIEFILGPFAVWAPYVFLFGALASAVFFYIKKFSAKWYWVLVWATLGFKALFAAFLSWGQYFVWLRGGEFTQTFLNTPLSADTPDTVLTFVTKLFRPLFETEKGYFLFYAYSRFWINLIVLIVAAIGFWLFLKMLKKYRARFFDTGEVELGFLMALVAGWPGFLVFVPLVFLAVVFVSIFRGIFLKEAYTTLGWPMLLAALLTLIWGSSLIDLLNLGVFRI
ncbi:MAG: hypothetical protein HYS87_02560 [Candidatus Colwellbacteria bacterium]|nr:hypothetical protein [Candidatus Colwellbacteria bacterium]